MVYRGMGLAALGSMLVALGAGAAFCVPLATPEASTRAVAAASGFVAAPVAFIEQPESRTSRSGYVVRGESGSVVFGPCGVTYHLGRPNSRSSVGLSFVAPDTGMRLVPGDRLAARINYLTGPDEAHWRKNVPAFGAVRYTCVWPGIDIEFRGVGSHIKYDILASPGADISKIALRFEGADSVSVTRDGSLTVQAGDAVFTETIPAVYQVRDGRQIEIEGRFTLNGGVVGVDVEGYDPSLPLVIDPASDLNWSVLVAGSDYDSGQAIARGADGSMYIAGDTMSANLPGPAGSYDRTYNLLSDAYVAKLSPVGALVYLTYLGGAEDDFGKCIAVDSAGSAYVGGYTESHGFPVTNGVFGPTHHNAGNLDGFVTKLTPSGDALDYSTFVGGVENDWVFGIAVGHNKLAYICGQTGSSDFPVTPGVYDSAYNGSYDAFIARISQNGSALQFSTFVGGSDTDWATCIAIDSVGDAYIGGLTQSTDYPVLSAYLSEHRALFDGFVTRLDKDGGSLVFSTYLGGYGQDSVNALALDANANIYVTGTAGFSGFPTTAGVFDPDYDGGNSDAFVTSFTSAGAIRYSTFIGGLGDDTGNGIAVDASQRPYVVGQTSSANFPKSAGAYSVTMKGTDDAFLTRLSAGGTAVSYSTYLGGGLSDIAKGVVLDDEPSVYMIGYTSSSNFPSTSVLSNTTIGAFDVNAFVAHLLGTTTGDTSPPTTPVVTDDGAFTLSTDTLHASWSSSDPESGVASYEYAIGTAPTDPGSGYLVGWKSVGASTQATETGLTLQAGTRYYWYVRAKNGQALQSAVGVSDGILAVTKTASTPAEAKLEADGVALVVEGVVTATAAELGQRIYIEAADRSSAISCAATDSCSEGDRVQVAGVMATVEGERVVSAASVVVTSAGSPLLPLVMTLRSTSGGAFSYNSATGAGQRAVTLPSYGGVSSVGLLVSVNGRVTALDAEHLYLNDGSWDGISLKVSRQHVPAGVQVGSVLALTGVASMRQDGADYRTVILPRREADTQIVVP